MNNRSGIFTIRLKPDERAMLDALAAQMERKPGDAVRVIVRRVAGDMGITVPARTAGSRTEQEQLSGDRPA